MSKSKNQGDTNACGGGGYKPLIATSLALVLGMSEVSAGGGIKLTQSGDINGGSIDTPVQFEISSPNDSIAGILVKPESLSKEIIATLKGNVTITSEALKDTSKNIYGIYVDNGGKTSFKSDDFAFRTITTEEIVSLESGKEAYVFKNAGSGEVEFKNVGLVSGVKSSSNPAVFGICNDVDASYSFGSIDSGAKFVIEGVAGTSGDTHNDGLSGLEASGIVVSAKMRYSGNLSQSITGGVGGNATAEKRAGGVGGSAYGLDFVEGGGSYILLDSKSVLNLTVTGGKGGNGSNGNGEKGDKGDGGDAVGIYSSSSSANLTLGKESRAVIAVKGGTVGEKGKENTGVGGEAIGVLVYTDFDTRSGATPTISRSKLTISGTGTLALDVGDSTNTSVAYGLKLESGVFAGDLNFASGKISATREAYGIYSSGESTIEGGIVSFAKQALNTKNGRAYILFNKGGGTFTIAGGAGIINADTPTNHVGITDEYGGVYAFGGSATGVGTQIIGMNAETGFKASITGVYFEPKINDVSITLGGKLGVRGGNATGTKGGGDAIGLMVDVSSIPSVSKTNSVIDQGGFTLEVVGGNAREEGDKSARGGLATGLRFLTDGDKSIVVSGGNISLALINGSLGKDISLGNYTNALVHDGEGKVIFEGVTLYNLHPSSKDGKIPDRRYGIYNLAASAYDFGSLGGSTIFSSFKTHSGKQAVGIYSSADHMWSVGEVVFEGIIGGVGQSNNEGNGRRGGDAIGLKLQGLEYTLEQYGKISMTIIGGQGGDGSAESGKGGDGGDAYGLVVDSGGTVLEFEEDAELLLKVQGGAPAKAGKDGGIAGDAVGILVGSYGGKNTKKDRSFQIGVHASSVIKLQVGDKNTLSNNKNAYGLKLADSAYDGYGVVIGFNGEDSWIAANDGNGKAYAVYTSGESVIKSGVIVITKDGLLGQEKYALCNDGHLTLGELARIVTGSKVVTNVNLYASDGATLDAVFGSGSTTVFRADRAFGSSGSGAVNVTLESSEAKGGAKLVFDGDAGNLGMLKGNNVGIILAGIKQNDVIARIASKGFFAKKIEIADMQLKDSTFVLAAKTNGAKIADSIHISGSKATDVQNNNIAIILDKYSTDSTPVTLATVSKDAKDKAIFNGLTESGMSAKSATYSGFTTAQVTITREEGENGGVKYVSTLQPTGTSINVDVITPTTVALSTGMSVFSVNLNSLSKRMGELRDDPYSHGVWARVFAGEQISDFGAKQAMVYTTLQVGYDYRFDFENADNYLGAAISYIKGSGGKVSLTHKSAPTLISEIISELTSCNTNGVEIAIYNSYIAHSGFYSDSVMKLGYFDNTLSLYAQPQTYKTENFAFALSEEVGYRFALGKNNEWFITPQGELSLGYIGESAFTQRMFGEEMDSRQEGVMILRSRVGSAWGYDFSHLMQKFKISAYMGTYYVYDCFIGGDTFLKAFSKIGEYVTLRDNAYKGGGRFAANLGANVSVKERVKVYADFEKSFGGNIQTNYQISLGVRFGFGEKISAPKLEERKTAGDVLKPKELQKAE